MNIYLIVVLIFYLFFLILFPVLNRINHWFDVELGVLYAGEILGVVNIFVIFHLAKFIKLKMKGKLGNGMITGILHTPEPIRFADKQNLLYAGSRVLYYNDLSETFFEKLANLGDSRDPYSHYKVLKEVSLFADGIVLRHEGREIPFTGRFKSMIESGMPPRRTADEVTYPYMIEHAEKGLLGTITPEMVREAARYTKNGVPAVNHSTAFVLQTYYVYADEKEDLIIGLDENLEIDMNAFRHAIEPNYDATPRSMVFFLFFVPLLWIAVVSFMMPYGGGFVPTLSGNVTYYLYSTFFQLPLYYLLGWKYIALYNRTSL
jgi:hypothetical protein